MQLRDLIPMISLPLSVISLTFLFIEFSTSHPNLPTYMPNLVLISASITNISVLLLSIRAFSQVRFQWK